MVAMRAEIMRRRVRTLTILEAERLDRLAAQGVPA
jgi:heme exporter protein C